MGRLLDDFVPIDGEMRSVLRLTDDVQDGLRGNRIELRQTASAMTRWGELSAHHIFSCTTSPHAWNTAAIRRADCPYKHVLNWKLQRPCTHQAMFSSRPPSASALLKGREPAECSYDLQTQSTTSSTQNKCETLLLFPLASGSLNFKLEPTLQITSIAA